MERKKSPPSGAGCVQRDTEATGEVWSGDGLVTRNVFCCHRRKRGMWEECRRDREWDADGKTTDESINNSGLAGSSGHLAGRHGRVVAL